MQNGWDTYQQQIALSIFKCKIFLICGLGALTVLFYPTNLRPSSLLKLPQPGI